MCLSNLPTQHFWHSIVVAFRREHFCDSFEDVKIQTVLHHVWPAALEEQTVHRVRFECPADLFGDLVVVGDRIERHRQG